MRVVDGALIADNEDYHIERDTMHVNEFGDYVVFRCLTGDGQLFGAAVPRTDTVETQLHVGAVVMAAASSAPPASVIFVPTAFVDLTGTPATKVQRRAA